VRIIHYPAFQSQLDKCNHDPILNGNEQYGWQAYCDECSLTTGTFYKTKERCLEVWNSKEDLLIFAPNLKPRPVYQWVLDKCTHAPKITSNNKWFYGDCKECHLTTKGKTEEEVLDNWNAKKKNVFAKWFLGR